MSTIRRKKPHVRSQIMTSLPKILVLLIILLIFLLAFPRKNKDVTNRSLKDSLSSTIQSPLLDQIPKLRKKAQSTPARLKKLIQEEKIVGERLGDIKTGSLTVDQVLQGEQAPMRLKEVTDFISDFLHRLHELQIANKNARYPEIWDIYFNLAKKILYPWDREYLRRMPERRSDNSVFLSLASYRDENCLSTIKQAYGKAKNPEKLFVGLVQQNCEANCMSGVLKTRQVVPVEPDEDCHNVFCSLPEGKPHCDAGRVRALHVNETESLGPYAARYFASKLWLGEQWYMQIDSHMTFAQDWDAISIQMLQNAPSEKPVISHYPPGETFDFERFKNTPGGRLCGPVFAESEIEAQIIRLQGVESDKVKLDVPRFAPFVAAGYFVAHSEFLREVPFDPFLPWIFMGEEIIMSARLWTSGYDIFSPTEAVVGHIYVRREKPKFWETTHRVFRMGVHNPLQMMILDRVKYQINYPEAARDMLKTKSVLYKVEEYSMGKVRKVEDYLEMAGLDMDYKRVKYQHWCANGHPPKGFEQYADLYKT